MNDEDTPKEGGVALVEDARPTSEVSPDPVIALLEEWLADESGYDEEAWPELKEALDRERELIGARRLLRE